jgi:DNA-binding transcriptional LysR family regulator
MLALVEASDMISVLPELAVARQSHRVEWRRLAPLAERRLTAVTRIGQDELPAVRELVDELAQVTAESVLAER